MIPYRQCSRRDIVFPGTRAPAPWTARPPRRAQPGPGAGRLGASRSLAGTASRTRAWAPWRWTCRWSSWRRCSSFGRSSRSWSARPRRRWSGGRPAAHDGCKRPRWGFPGLDLGVYGAWCAAGGPWWRLRHACSLPSSQPCCSSLSALGTNAHLQVDGASLSSGSASLGLRCTCCFAYVHTSVRRQQLTDADIACCEGACARQYSLSHGQTLLKLSAVVRHKAGRPEYMPPQY